MGISAGHAYPEIQPPYGGHSEPWVWGYDVSPPSLLSSPRQECVHAEGNTEGPGTASSEPLLPS